MLKEHDILHAEQARKAFPSMHTVVAHACLKMRIEYFHMKVQLAILVNHTLLQHLLLQSQRQLNRLCLQLYTSTTDDYLMSNMLYLRPMLRSANIGACVSAARAGCIRNF